ncbi:hypothetical protein CDA63_14200 [Hymenobacter amundsenii]|uniref:WG repeat-containing protein n=1 Tax=Hymenobacter amundsenii TaxID=2006685 RepID=A0A246FIR9_9BACT|nr:WG repeat-containing protein [Hymenobacter amundsenii]OWP62436.1 hypothetical protein CDA63_14200 [Hymenobacter amundsenii]
MKLLLFAAALLLNTTIAAAQQKPDEVWTKFEKKQRGEHEYSYGYKDAAGRIRVPARLGGFTSAQKFRHIIAVSEYKTMQQYYLLKNGRQVGRDSVYMFDYTFDCESEGKILFRDQVKNRVGFLDSQGRAIIPAVYNYATPFRNGLALALIGARRECWGGEEDTVQCEHLGWVGGRTVLLNERNQVQADSLPRRQLDDLNWYSLQINALAADTAITRTFRAVNGDRYTFVDYKKEFTGWLDQVFLPAVRSGEASQVVPLCYADLAASGKPFRGWEYFKGAAFVQKFYRPLLRPKLQDLRVDARNVAVFSESLNTLTFTSPRFQDFLTDCGAHFEAKYPAFSVVITEVDAVGQKQYDHQTHLTFIRTAEGYRLFMVSV